MTKETKIHFFYILLILLTIIVGLVSIKWSTIPDLVNLIGFSATIASLILAVLAIVYAFYTNASNEKNVTRINNASDNISSSSETLVQLTNDLKKKVDGLHPLIESVGEKTSQTNDLLNNMILKDKVGDEKTNANIGSGNVVNVEGLLYGNSIAGLMILYALKAAYKSEKPFNIKDLSQKIKIFFEDYSFGYLVCLSSLDILGYEVIKDEEEGESWKITWLANEILEADIEQQIFTDAKESEALKDQDYTTSILEIKNYFA